ncbi:MAG: YbaB/EbfC family nucleoid-associated protein [Acetobacter sp.]|nr:YbaB/EbfC family nucleoid-associated protein [Acetobacter sp.]
MAYGGFGGFGGGNMQAMLRQAQKMQEDMARTRRELDETEFSARSGGGMVEVVMMGNKTLKAVNIKQEVVDPDDVEMLEDLIVSAFNDAISQIEKAEKEKLPQIPGM